MGALWIPGRHGFRKLIFGHSFRSTIWVIHHIKSVEHGKGQFLSIWRRNGITNLRGKLVRAVFDCIVEIQSRAHGYIDISLERDFCSGSTVYGHLPYFSSIGGHHKLAVWGKGHRRKYALRGNRLLLVTLHWVGEPFFVPRLEVSDHQTGLVLPSGAIDHPVAILTQGWGEGGTVARGDAGDFSLVKIVVAYLVLRK